MKHVFFALMALLFASTVNAEEKLVVFAGAVCPLDVAKAEVARMERSIISIDPRCRPMRLVIPIVKIHSGPYRDWEGDQFYIVQVDKDGLWFTFAWPGHNSNLPKTSGA